MGTVADKLTYLNNTKQGLKNVINYTGAGIDSNTTFRDYEEKLYNGYLDILKDNGETLFNNLPKVTGEGTSVTLNDTANAPMKMIPMASELEQETTTQSANLFNQEEYSDRTFATGTYKYTLTNLKYNGNQFYIGASLKEGKSALSGLYIAFTDIGSNPNSGVSNFPITNGAARFYAFSLTNDVPIYLSIYPTSITWEQVLEVYDLWVTRNVNQSTYIPFVPDSPSPDYPQEIHTISGDNEIVVDGGINLWDEKWELGDYNDRTGTKVGNSGKIRNKYPIKIKPNTLYYVKTPVNLNAYYYDNNMNFVSAQVTTGINGQFTSPANSYYMNFSTFGSSTTTTYNNNICINKFNPSINNNYYPYQEQTLPLNLPVENLWNSNFERAEYDASGNKITTSVWLVNETKLSVKPNTTYTISQKETPSQYRTIYFNNGNYLSRKDTTQNTTIGHKNYTFTTPSNCNGVYIQFRSTLEKISQGTYDMFVDDITNAQLEQGTKANTYTPYGTEPIEVCKIGDYEDEFVYNTTDTTLELNKWYLKKNIGKVVLDGSEDWEEYTGGHAEGFYVYFRAFVSFKMGWQTTKCTHFNNVNASWMTDLNKNGRYSDHTSLAYRYFVTNEYDTNTKFKEFVANEYQNNTPITLYGKLATPEYIPLNDTLQTQLNNIQKALSYQDQTNVSQVNNDLPFILKLSAIQKYTE